MKATLPPALQAQLSQLPAKVASVLMSLYTVEHIDDAILTTVLTAGVLSGETHKLAAFAVSYLALRQKGVPIGDVIAMAKQHDRKINLWWSPLRWQQEHQRLARLSTLKRLAEQNVRYTLEGFRNQLPVHFNGYLIPSSRRLGMEGLRQRHCVASWHDRLLSGRYAIAVVFVDQIRWTVELCVTENALQPLLIGQIKSRFNKEPTPVIRSAIYSALQLEEPKAKPVQNDTEPYRCLYLHNFAQMVPLLREVGVKQVYVTFDGSCDSGQIDEVDFVPPLKSPLMVDVIEKSIRHQQGVNQVTFQTVRKNVSEAFKDLVEDYLETTGVDWYNGDGGYGELVMDLAQEQLRMEVFQRYTESERRFDEEFDFAQMQEYCLPATVA